MHSLCQNGRSVCVYLMVYLPRLFALFLDPSAAVSLMSLALVSWGLRWEHTRLDAVGKLTAGHEATPCKLIELVGH